MVSQRLETIQTETTDGLATVLSDDGTSRGGMEMKALWSLVMVVATVAILLISGCGDCSNGCGDDAEVNAISEPLLLAKPDVNITRPSILRPYVDPGFGVCGNGTEMKDGKCEILRPKECQTDCTLPPAHSAPSVDLEQGSYLVELEKVTCGIPKGVARDLAKYLATYHAYARSSFHSTIHVQFQLDYGVGVDYPHNYNWVKVRVDPVCRSLDSLGPSCGPETEEFQYETELRTVVIDFPLQYDQDGMHEYFISVESHVSSLIAGGASSIQIKNIRIWFTDENGKEFTHVDYCQNDDFDTTAVIK